MGKIKEILVPLWEMLVVFGIIGGCLYVMFTMDKAPLKTKRIRSRRIHKRISMQDEFRGNEHRCDVCHPGLPDCTECHKTVN